MTPMVFPLDPMPMTVFDDDLMGHAKDHEDCLLALRLPEYEVLSEELSAHHSHMLFR